MMCVSFFALCFHCSSVLACPIPFRMGDRSLYCNECFKPPDRVDRLVGHLGNNGTDEAGEWNEEKNTEKKIPHTGSPAHDSPSALIYDVYGHF
jgi:hypothetical protein